MTEKLLKVFVPMNLLGLGGFSAGGCSPRGFAVTGRITKTKKRTTHPSFRVECGEILLQFGLGVSLGALSAKAKPF